MSGRTLQENFLLIREGVSNLEGGPSRGGGIDDGGHVGNEQRADGAHSEALDHGKNTVTEVGIAVESIGESISSVTTAEEDQRTAITALEDVIKNIGTVANLLGKSSDNTGAAVRTTHRAIQDGTGKAQHSHTDFRDKLEEALGASGTAATRGVTASARVYDATEFKETNALMGELIENIKPIPKRSEDYRDALGDANGSATIEDSQAIVATHKAFESGEESLRANVSVVDAAKEILENASASFQTQLDAIKAATEGISKANEGFTEGRGKLDEVKGHSETAVGILSDKKEEPSILANMGQKAANAGNKYLAPHGV